MHTPRHKANPEPASKQRGCIRRPTQQPAPLSPEARLQRVLGNQAYRRLIQAKLEVGPPNDRYEREADRVADAVMRMPEPAIQRACDCGGTCAQCQEEAVQRQSVAETITPLVQRQIVEEEEEVLQRQAEEEDEEPIQRQVCMIEDEEVPVEAEESVQPKYENASMQGSKHGPLYASADLSRRIKQARGQGQPLPKRVQHGMERSMGADFSGVRIHTDPAAVQMSRALRAQAFTHSKDIFFNAGEYNPESAEGKHLLAHELTHTIQQNRDVVRRLSISVQSPLARGPCGQRRVRWIFALGSPAPADGYIVQQVDEYNEESECPSFGRCLARPTSTFWEAWFVNRGDTHEHLHATLGFTDQSAFGGSPDKAGYRVHNGEVKFFRKSVTGDLGKDGVAPASPNGGWGPGNVPITGDLPSTSTPPPWWGNAPTEGPVTRQAYSAWRCCGDKRDFNVVRARP